MNTPTHKTYKFATFQEMFDTVPADRISECLREIGIVLSKAKSFTELVLMTAQSFAKDAGVELPRPSSMAKLPEVFEWHDDGKGELGARFKSEEGAESKLELNFKCTP